MNNLILKPELSLETNKHTVYWSVVNYGTPQIYRCEVSVDIEGRFYVVDYEQIYGEASFPNPPSESARPFEHKNPNWYWVHMEKIDCFHQSERDAAWWCIQRVLDYRNFLKRQIVEKRERIDYVENCFQNLRSTY